MRSKRLQPVIQLALQREELAARQLGVGNKQLVAEQLKLEQLRDYRNEYIDQHHVPRSDVGVSIVSLSNLSAFMSQLDYAIETQQQQISKIEKQRDHLRENWQQAYRWRLGIEKVHDSLSKEEQYRLEKRLQQELDDISASSF